MTPLLLSALATASPYADGVAGMEEQSVAEAIAERTAAVRAAPEDAGAWWRLGWAHWADGDFVDVLHAWEQTAALDPSHEGPPFWLPAAHYRLTTSIGPQVMLKVSEEPSQPGLHIVAGGDTMLGSDLRRGADGLPPDDGAGLLAPFKELFEGADVAFLNLEGTLADGVESTKCGPQSTSCYAFRSPTRFTAALTSVGIDVVSHANNHAMDLAEPGILATAAALDGVGIAHAGRYGDIALFERAGAKVAVVAAHSGECCLNVNDLHEVTTAVVWANEQADIVIFSFHGGAEGSKARHVPGRTEVAWGEQRGDVKALARAAVDAGADLVLGHGPHVLRAMEVYKGRLVAYSLGNFVGYRQFGTKGGYTGTSAILDVQLAANGALISGRLHPVTLDEEAVPQPDPTGRAWSQIVELSAEDFPDTAVRVGAEGALSWGQEPR